MADDSTGSGATERIADDLDATRRVPPPGSDMPTILGSPASPARADALPSSIGPYEIRAELGRGGMGVVYRAFDPGLRREVALKVLLVSGRVGVDAIERFHREARAAAKLSHPGIVQLHDVGEGDGKPYYTMELLPGRGLDDALRDPGLSPREAVDVVRQVALALHYAHERGVLHRDVKPRNVVVARETNGWTAKVVDFGLAKLIEQELRAGGDGSSGPTLTRTGEVLGTPVYMSPEQVRGDRAIDARSDVYSLGVTLYEAIAGRVPFDHATLAHLFHAIVREDPTPPRSLNPALDPDLATVCVRCLQKDPAHRYSTAGQLAEDCRRWLEGEPIAARPVGAVVRLWRRAKRNRSVAVPMGILVLALTTIVVGWITGRVGDAVRFRLHVERAEEALRLGHPGEAGAEASLARRLDPDDPRPKRLLAEVAFGKGQDVAGEYAEHKRQEQDLSFAAAPTVREDRWKRGAALDRARTLRRTTWSKAVVEFHAALNEVPDHAKARSALAGGVSEWTSTEHVPGGVLGLPKGGCWTGVETACRAAVRSGCELDGVRPYVGFRVLAERVK